MGKQYGDKNRCEIDAELLSDSTRAAAISDHECNQFESIEQMSDFIRENFIELLDSEYKERAIEFLIDDLNKIKSQIFDL